MNQGYRIFSYIAIYVVAMIDYNFIVSGSIKLVAGSYRLRTRALAVENATIVYSGSQNVAANDPIIVSLTGGREGKLGNFTAEEINRARWLNILFGVGSFSQRDILGGTITAARGPSPHRPPPGTWTRRRPTPLPSTSPRWARVKPGRRRKPPRWRVSPCSSTLLPKYVIRPSANSTRPSAVRQRRDRKSVV
jgi:hypothetical protein